VVTAFDASRELAIIASQALETPVRVMSFQDLESNEEFDGIWACASLLHVLAVEMDGVLIRLVKALKPDAVLYVSFKYGTAEGFRDGRFFNDYDEAKFQALIERHTGLILEKSWRTNDSRPGREEELWLNALVRKSSGARSKRLLELFKTG
jgi:hypothetical protein